MRPAGREMRAAIAAALLGVPPGTGHVAGAGRRAVVQLTALRTRPVGAAAERQRLMVVINQTPSGTVGALLITARALARRAQRLDCVIVLSRRGGAL